MRNFVIKWAVEEWKVFNISDTEIQIRNIFGKVQSINKYLKGGKSASFTNTQVFNLMTMYII